VLRVLAVCTGNICRSPLAEAFFAARSDLVPGGLSVRSAGTWANDGMPATRESRLAGRERGVDLEGHRSSRLTSAAIREADLILGMTAEHVEGILALDPSAAARTFTLKELAAILRGLPGTGDVRARLAEADRHRDPALVDDVADPLGLGMEIYRHIALEVDVAVDEILAGLGAGTGAARTAEA